MFFVFFLCLLLTGCFEIKRSQQEAIKQRNERKDCIHRNQQEHLYTFHSTLSLKTRDPYPWEVGYVGSHGKITKEVFRCKGGQVHQGTVCGCGGFQKHSLPMKGGKEFIYPVLLEILNELQVKTAGEVVVTCGHRCPVHNKYADPSSYNLSSKHMMGAEVDFYIQGWEDKAEQVIELIMEGYRKKYPEQKAFYPFQRLDKEKVNVSTPPWYNQEILIKLYRKEEGRDLDNQHAYPYISLQVRWDRDTEEKVIYSKEKALNGYVRY